MCSFKSIYFVIFILNLYRTRAEISDKRLCVDQDCNEPVSLGKTLLRYSSPDIRILSFSPNTEVTIYSKEAGSETGLWGAVIKGKRGYIPKHLVRELKVYKKPTLLVDTELNHKPQVPEKPSKRDIDPDNVKKPFEVVDGTTIYLNPQDSINPSSTESPVLSTTLPPVNDVEQVPEDTKEQDNTKKDAQESVLEKVSSSFSKWISDDAGSEEVDAEDDDEEDDEDEEDEEESSEDDLEQTENKSQEPTPIVTQGIDTLHNLPPGVKVSPYSLEVDQVDGSNETTKEHGKQEPPQESNNSEPVPEMINEKEKLPEPINESEEKLTAETVEYENIEKPETLASENDEQTNKESEHTAKINSVSNTISPPSATDVEKVVESEKDEQLNKEPPSTNSEEEIKTVIEPSIDIEQEQLPFLDVTTPDPLQSIEQEDIKQNVDGISMQNAKENTNMEVNPSIPDKDQVLDLPQTRPVDSPSDNSSENQDLAADQGEHALDTTDLSQTPLDLPSDDASENQGPAVDEGENVLNTTDLPQTPVDSPSNNTSENQELATDDGEHVLDNAENNVVENRETENKNEIYTETVDDSSSSDQNNFNKVFTENTNEQQVPGGSDEIVNAVEDLNKDPSSTENINIDHSTETDEPVVSNLEKQLDTDDKTKQEGQEVVNDVKEELQRIDIESNIEISSEDPIEVVQEESLEETNEYSESGGIWSGLFSFFDNSDKSSNSAPSQHDPIIDSKEEENVWVPQHPENPITSENFCDGTSDSCGIDQREAIANETGFFDNIELKFNSDFFLLLITTAGSVIIFLFVYMALDRHKREGPLIARINKLEKELLVTLKENELLQEKGTSAIQVIESDTNEVVEQLTQNLAETQISRQALQEKVADLEAQLETKAALEEQMESLEKELETSTEVGMELNRIISEMLDPTNGSDRLRENVEQLQRQLLEQKDTINSISESLQERELENRALHTDLERSKKVAVDFQNKVEELVEKILKIEREKDQQQNSLQKEITIYQQKYNEGVRKEEVLNSDNQIIRVQLAEVQRQADIKMKEYQTLKESLKKIKSLNNDSNALQSLLDTTTIKAEIQQLKSENATYAAQLQQEQAIKVGFEKKYQTVVEEISLLKEKYEQADKEKVEVNSKLEVLNNYFKKRESELQEEIIRYKSIWDAKEGEATSTTERIKYMQEEIENYKAQNETLKQEIISQEIDLKSQISVLEKKVHENWVTARQTERKLEDARQEAAQLRNRLTLRERAINEERIQNRLQSPIEQNGELPLSPHPIDSPASPPLLYGARDHITKSPPIPGLPPFLPPPPGAPFMPPLHGMPPFMPPPPSMFPGDHRPPPLGRMSSPPLNSRYSPDTSAFSPYDRHSPSPPYDSEYGASPPPIRGYSPYNSRDDRRDYKRPPHGRTNGRNGKGSVMSSGSDHSNDSLDKINRKQSKMV